MTAPTPAAAARMRSALLFGASGQIGEALLQRLLQEGWEVIAVSRRPPAVGIGTLRWVQGDLRSGGDWPARVDAIFSCGPLDLFSLWYEGSALRCRRVIAFGSTSAAVKQASPDAAERELAQRLQDGEARLLAAADARGAGATLLRPTLVYGMGRDQTLTRIAMIARRTRCFVLPAGADGLRQPVHVDDLAQAARAALDAPRAHGRTYALPGGETLPYREMVGRVLRCLRPPARLIQAPAPLFKLALAAARMGGRMRGASDAVLVRMREDLVFDGQPAREDFGYAPRRFEPAADMFEP
ncbi:MAG TPA: NAD-dependent epimerase/dehydratase family protein [Pseudoxanthomonas sp.]|nr:NAD-dependent epimerase/dehydratase family protein [Pseudoxanthomonas sp.]